MAAEAGSSTTVSTGREEEPSNSRMEENGNMVPCPLCQKPFPQDQIEVSLGCPSPFLVLLMLTECLQKFDMNYML